MSDTDPFRGRPATSPGFLLWRTTLRWQRDVAAALKPLGLTHVQFVLLASVWWLTEQARTPAELPSQTQVASYAAADVMMTSSVLRTLEARGWVTRSPDASDARVKRLEVTAEGRRLAVEAVALVESVDHAFFSRAHDPEQVLDVLSRLADVPPEARP